METLHVLIVEDNPDDAELLLRHLRRSKYEIHHQHVSTEAELRKALAGEEWDVVLSDFKLANFTGFDAIEALKETGLDVPMIIISGTIGEETAATLMRKGVSDYLMKDNLSRLMPAIVRELQEAEHRREKRRAEKALADSEERLNLALSATGMGVWDWDLDTGLVLWSPECKTILGFDEDGSHIRTVRSMIFEEDLVVIDEEFARALRERTVINLKFRLRRPDGTVVWVAETGSYHFDENGRAIRAIGTALDITRDKLAEDALIEAEERYRVIAETASDAVISIDDKGTILFANPAVETIFGYQPGELIGKPLRTIMPESSHGNHDRGFSNYLKTGKKTFDWGNFEMVALRKDGKLIVTQISFGEHKTEGQHIFTGFIRNITDRKRAENVLRESEGNFRALVDATSRYVWRLDAEGNITDQPDWWVELTGQNFEDAVKYGWLEMIHPDDRERVKAEFVQTIESRKPVRLELRIRRANGEYGYYIARAVPLPQSTVSNHRWICALTDVSLRRSAENALRESEHRLRTILNAEPECVKILSLEGKIIDMNPAGLAVVEAETLDDVVGMSAERFMTDEQLAKFATVIERVSAGGHEQIEYALTGLKGTSRWLDMRAVPLRDPSGAITSMLGVSRDVTDRKKIEEDLVASQRQYKELINTIEGIVWEADANTFEFSFVSDQAEAIVGFPAAKWLERGFWEDHIHPDDRQWAVDFCVTATAKGEPHSFEYRMISANGGAVWLRDMVTVIMENGKPSMLRGLMVDITEQKATQIAIVRQGLLIEQAYEAIFVWDIIDGIIDWNKGCERLYGYTREEALGTFGYELLKSSFPDGYDTMMRTLKSERVWAGEIAQITKDGTEVYVDSRFQLIEYDGKQIVLQTNRDITENRKAELALRESEARYRDLFENNPYPMWANDTETLKFLAVNDSAVSHYGYSREEFLAMDIRQVVPPEEIDAVIQRASSREDRIQPKGSVTHIKKDGTRIKVEVTSHYLEFDGRPARIALSHDVTDRLIAQEAVEQSEARYRELFENANDLIYTRDLEGNFTSLNHAGERITGFSEAEAVGRNIAEVVSPEFRRLMGVAEQGPHDDSPPTINEIEFVAKDGRKVPLEITTRYIYQNGERVGVQGIGRDISERKNAEAALKASEEQFRQIQKLESIGILAGGISHDFNNMLTAINGYSDLILRKIASDDPIRANVLEIRKAGERSAELTRQLLAFSRRQIMQPKVLDLNDIIADTSTMLQRLIGENIAISTKFEKDLYKVEADPGQLTQVLVNLVVNSKDAMPEGGSLIVETANVQLDETFAGGHIDVKAGDFVMLSVSDTGVGMDEDTRKKVFEPFFTTKSVGQGTGLGLSTVYGIVKQSGGNIWVYSEPGVGTTFKIYLPRVMSEGLRSDLETSQRDLRIGNETLMLVEDEASVRALASEILRSCGYTIIEAANGVEALTAFERSTAKPHLLITDIVMPEMSGRELAERVADLYPETKVLFTSGYTDDAVLRHGIIDEGRNFLQKPFTFASLSAKVRSLLDGESP